MNLLILYATLTITLSFLCSILEAVLLSVNPTFLKIKINEGKKYAENLQRFFLYFEVQESLIINKIKNPRGLTPSGRNILELIS